MGAVLTAAGSGRRFGGGVPKALVPLAGRALVTHAAEALERSGIVQHLAVTAPGPYVDAIRAAVREGSALGVTVVPGGGTRQASVAAGLAVLPETDITLVHDAARPLASAELIRALIDQVHQGDEAVVPGVAVTDTVKQVDQGSPPHAVRTVDRAALRAIQTPQAFRSDVLRRAHAAAGDLAAHESTALSDDAGLAELAGVAVRVIEGEPRALKITTTRDLALAELFVTEES